MNKGRQKTDRETLYTIVIEIISIATAAPFSSTGARRWDSLDRLADLVELAQHLGAQIPALEPLFLNLGAVPARRLETAGAFFGWVLRLVQERRAQPTAFQAVLHRAVNELEAMPAAERQRWLELLSYVLALVYHERQPAEHGALQEEVEASVRTDEHRREVAVMGRTIADELRAQGRKEGRREGTVDALRGTLLNQLGKRFGRLPSVTVSAIEATADIEQLRTWLDRFATASTLEEVGIDAN